MCVLVGVCCGSAIYSVALVYSVVGFRGVTVLMSQSNRVSYFFMPMASQSRSLVLVSSILMKHILSFAVKKSICWSGRTWCELCCRPVDYSSVGAVW
jgi:hypothetical protein